MENPLESHLSIIKKRSPGDRSAMVTIEMPFDKYDEYFGADPMLLQLALKEMCVKYKLNVQATNIQYGQDVTIRLRAQEYSNP